MESHSARPEMRTSTIPPITVAWGKLKFPSQGSSMAALALGLLPCREWKHTLVRRPPQAWCVLSTDAVTGHKRKGSTVSGPFCRWRNWAMECSDDFPMLPGACAPRQGSLTSGPWAGTRPSLLGIGPVAGGELECYARESSRNHPCPDLIHGKIAFHKTGPRCQKDWGPLL